MSTVADGWGVWSVSYQSRQDKHRRLSQSQTPLSLHSMRDKKTSSKSSSSTSPCAPLRDAYNSCFNRWYAEKFMKGHWDKEECVSEWQKYRACLSQHLEDKHLSRFLEAKEIDQDHLRNGAAASQ